MNETASLHRTSMPSTFHLEFRLKQRVLIPGLAVVIGLYFWLVWGHWQTIGMVEWLRLGIAFLVFLAPGWMLQALLWRGDDITFSQQLTVGFGAAVGLGAVLGLVATALHLALPFVLAAWGVTFAACLVLWSAQRGWQWHYRRQLHFDFAWIWVAIPVLAACWVAVRLTMRSVLEPDDLTYNAYLVHWLEAPTWNWNEIFWGIEQFAASRFWLAYWTLDEALLAKWSAIAGMELTRVYLPPFLTAVALLGTYALARGLGLSRALSGLALSMQVTAMLLLTGADQAGLVFLNRPVEDKAVAAFILTPLFVLAATGFLKQQTFGRILLTGILGAALVLTHPTIMAITGAAVGVYAVLDAIAQRRWRALLLLGLVLVLMLSAPLGIRLFDSAYADKLPFDIDSLQRQEQARRLLAFSGGLFVVNPNVVWGLPFLWTLGAGVVSAFRLKRSYAARWVFTGALVLLSVVNPVTAPLWGMAISAIQVWRVVWIIPFGIAAAYLAYLAVERIAKQNGQTRGTRRIAIILSAAAVVCLAGALFWLTNSENAGSVHALQEDAAEITKYENLLALKPDLENQLTAPTVVVGSSKWINDRLPGLAANVRAAGFRSTLNMWLLGNLEWADANTRFRALRKLYKGNTDSRQTLEFLQRYNVQFLVAKENTPWVNTLVSDFPARFRKIETRSKFKLYQVLP